MYVAKPIPVLLLLRRSWALQLRVLVAVTVVTTLYLEVLQPWVEVPLAVVTVLGTAISFFVGFMNNQAYARWWEARKIWGALVNDSRSLCRMAMSFVKAPTGSDVAEQRSLQRKLVRRHIAFLYAVVENLRKQTTRSYDRYLDDEDRSGLEGQRHTANGILGLQGELLDRAERERFLEVFRMTQMNEMLTRFSDSMGKAERIKSTVFPSFYATLVQMAIWFFIVVFPMALAPVVGYWAILYGYALGTLFLFICAAGQALVDPFENKPGDVSISAITRTIEINLLEQLGGEEVPELLQPVRGEYLL